MTRRLLTLVLLVFAANAMAAAPAAWSSRGCSGCHGSANIQSWPSRPYLQGLDSSNFVSRLQAQAANDAAMPTLANDSAAANGPADRAAILQYLLDVRDGKITNSLGLGTVTIDASSGNTGDVTITNERTRSITYTVPTFSASNGFAVSAQSCAARTVPAGSSCTLTIQFLPQSPPFTSATRSAVMSLTLAGTGGDPDPGARNVSLSGFAQTPLEMTTVALPPFTATQPNTSAAQTVTLANRLGSNLRLCLVDAASFSAPDNFNLVGRTYDAGPERCATVGPVVSQDITFTPTANGPRLARFTAQRVSSGGTLLQPLVSIDLEGNVGPFMSVSGTGLLNNTLFTGVRQDVNAGATAPSVVTLSNAGNETLRVSSVSIPLVAGAGSAEYAASGCAAGTTLAQGASCNLSVSFDPIDVDTRASQLLIGYSDAADTPASRRTAVIELRGQGTRGASLVVRDVGGTELATGSNVAFGQQNIEVPTTRRITLRNIGSDESLAVSAPVIAPASSGFDLVAPSEPDACASIATGITLGAGSSCVVDMRFLPVSVTPYLGTLTLPSRPTGASTAPNNFVLNLSGEGVDGRPRLEWQTAAGSALSLLEVPGVTAVGSATPPQVSLRLANLGPGAAALRLLNVIGADASNFTIDATAPGRCNFDSTATPLLEGASCEVVITFRPQTAGAKTSGLQLVSTGTTPAPLEIRGQASGPAATIALMATPASMDLNEVRVGAQSAPAAITLTNDGTVAAVVTAIESSTGFVVERGSCGALPFTLEPRSSCALTVRFAPSRSGTTSGSVRVQVSGVASPIEVALEGTGAAAADVSGGGCSMTDARSPIDPTLWTLLLLAGIALYSRRRRRTSRRARPEDSRQP